MNIERAAMKGHLADLKMQKMELEAAISGNIKACKMFLAASAITPIARIDIDGALSNLREAAAKKHALAEVIGKITAIEDELDG